MANEFKEQTTRESETERASRVKLGALDEEETQDLSPSDMKGVKGGMTKSEFVEKVATSSDLTKG